ncbi:Metallo-dependent hydrolase [Durotheca rogersii]|uniref:Metallo-dependent hydrolase n=1 Tax=Durotheca rogersii TaxID=419775 RepID=UPI00221FB1ED|nr:Metallo-dependent hydrolase [Durotheca rogersii]KAI5860504.1 Metallo-dependent hydrolase [Durotheca rogersii]
MAEHDLEFDFKAMPKIELHAHLTGSISRECLHAIWAAKKAAGKTDLEDPLVVMPPGRHDYDLTTFFPLFSSYIYHLIDDVAALRLATRAVLDDFARDGVVYAELRTTPRALPAAGLDKAGYVAAVLDVMREHAAADPSGAGLRTRLILSVDRRDTPAGAREAVALAARFRARGVVGVDLCGDPSRGDVATFAPAFAAARAAGLRLTAHFAEAEACAPAELAEILSWQPDRLGHVIHVPPDVKRRLAAPRPLPARPLGLELCLSCNVHARMIVGSFEAHHFGEWWHVEGPVVVPCTDDVGVFESPLSNEWRLIQAHFGLGRDEILGLARKGIDVIFADDDERERLRRVMW